MNRKPLFTKKHYEAIAELLHVSIEKGDIVVNPSVTKEELADFFSKDNVNFNKDRFHERVIRGRVQS